MQRLLDSHREDGRVCYFLCFQAGFWLSDICHTPKKREVATGGMNDAHKQTFQIFQQCYRFQRIKTSKQQQNMRTKVTKDLFAGKRSRLLWADEWASLKSDPLIIKSVDWIKHKTAEICGSLRDGWEWYRCEIYCFVWYFCLAFIIPLPYTKLRNPWPIKRFKLHVAPPQPFWSSHLLPAVQWALRRPTRWEGRSSPPK